MSLSSCEEDESSEACAISVQILAHHPDLPSKEQYQEEHSSLQPFSLMLQFALQSLLSTPTGPAKQAGMSSAAPHHGWL